MAAEGSDVLTITKTTRKAVKLGYRGHLYVRQKPLANGFDRYRCELYFSTGCKGSAKATTDFSVFIECSPHSHERDFGTVKAQEARVQLKEVAATTRENPGRLYSTTVATLPDEARPLLGKRDNLRRMIRRQRPPHPPEPASIKDVKLEGIWTQTTTGDLFLIYDNGPDADSRIMMFASKTALRHMSRSDTWYMDGNFQVVPNLFMQTYVIRVKLGETSVTAVYCLLQRKTMSIYEEMFNALVAHCDDINLDLDPKCMNIDFEAAVIGAIRRVFGNEVDIQCCFFHLTQNTWSKVKELGLTNLYRENAEFRLLCGMMDGLAFLPIRDVKAGMQHLRETEITEAEELLRYFDETYVSGRLRTIRPRGEEEEEQIRVRMRTIPPMYGPDLWNCHEATLEAADITNNLTEAHNRKLGCHAGDGNQVFTE